MHVDGEEEEETKVEGTVPVYTALQCTAICRLPSAICSRKSDGLLEYANREYIARYLIWEKL